MYKIADDLVEGTFIRRPNRFIVFAEVGKREIRCHIANPGRMKELLHPGRKLLIKLSDDSKRTTEGSVLAVEVEEEIIQLNSNLVSKLVPWGLKKGVIPGIEGWRIKHKEFKILRGEKSHRLDYVLLDNDGQEVITEVKSTTLVRSGVACFPDAVSDRATSHVKLLAQLKIEGKKTMILFVVFRNSKRFSPCADIDPKFSEAYFNSLKLGVDAKAVQVCTEKRREEKGIVLYAKFTNAIEIKRQE